MAKIKPCPWCGTKMVSFNETSTYRWGAATCSGCGVVGPEIRKEYNEQEKDWALRALEAWNDRKTKEGNG